MRTIELNFVECRIREELIAHAASQGSYSKNEVVEVTAWQSR
jgi:hypothetical protein